MLDVNFNRDFCAFRSYLYSNNAFQLLVLITKSTSFKINYVNPHVNTLTLISKVLIYMAKAMFVPIYRLVSFGTIFKVFLVEFFTFFLFLRSSLCIDRGFLFIDFLKFCPWYDVALVFCNCFSSLIYSDMDLFGVVRIGVPS